MKHYVLFFGSTTQRHMTAVSFSSEAAAHRHAQNWCRGNEETYAIGQVRNIRRFKAGANRKRNSK